MKEVITRTWIILAVIFIIGASIFLFYWFQFKPVSVRATCQKQIDERMLRVKEIASSSTLSLSAVILSKKHGFTTNLNSKNQTEKETSGPLESELNELLGINEIFSKEEKQSLYQECLQRHGLK